MIDEPTIQHTAAQRTAKVHLTIPGSDMSKHIDPAVKEVLQVLKAQGIAPAGPLYSFHHCMPSDTFDFDIGFPVDAPVEASGRVQPGELPAARVARTFHHGPYEGLQEAWLAFGAWVKAQGLPADKRFYERYLDDPTMTDPSRYRTELNRILIG